MSNEHQNAPSLRNQSAWLMFAKTIGFFFSFALPFFVVRLLPQDEFGIYRQSFIVLTNIVSIFPLGFAMSAYYFLSREKEIRTSAIFNILLFNFFAGGIAFLTLWLYPDLLVLIFKSEEMKRLAPLIGLASWIWIFSVFLETVSVALKETRAATIFIILAQMSKAVLFIAAVVYFETVESIIWAAIVQGIVQTIILLLYLNSRFPRFWLSFDLKFFIEHFQYAIPFGLAAILWTFQTDVHNYFVGHRFSDAEFAIYAVGCFQLPLVSLFSESIGSVLIPRMSELQVAGDKKEMIRLTARSMQKLAFFFFPLTVFLMITAETFITTLYTKNYLASVPIFVLNLCLLPFFTILSDPIIRAYKELGRTLLKFRIFVFIGILALLYYGIHHFSLIGMMGIVVFGGIVEILLGAALLIYKLEVNWGDLNKLSGYGKTALISIVSGLVTAVFYYYVKIPAAGFVVKMIVSSFGEASRVPQGFISGVFVLGISFAVFLPIYLFLSNLWDVIDDDERHAVRQGLLRLRNMFSGNASLLRKSLGSKISNDA